jgi:hypothetical protein
VSDRIKVLWLEPTGDVLRSETPCQCGAPDCSPNVREEILYRRSDTGGVTTLRDAPVGAMWDATWFDDDPLYTGADGISLVVRTPGGTWMVDSRASNCTLPDDDVHKCWVRHGDPRTGELHVDKNGVTCSAGAGSILSGSYHGFLHNGYLVSC